MTRTEARRHQAHLCDVWLTEDGEAYGDEDGQHLGVIESLGTKYAVVSGHPVFGTRRVPVEYLTTNCRITD